ncbi:hypothetical protein ABIE26_001131 [Pedobacter africanus]|uniref:Uncharacterized protein n=1 Tax=Pedobacter africanus TaxID=151894 RepID=A0ACC6KT55_9SPHI|nr:RagB/SusD family nutrient uptake outer membrane protein [Pedobacter africanus]MDR6782381.1 hypothetical protein [Pedobacter africanus]
MKTQTKIFFLMAMFILASGTGCKKFLEVEPKSTIGEDQLFSSEIGFQQALTGLYSQMASRDLYGDNLTMGFSSLIAQNYSTSLSGVFSFPTTVALNFKGADAVPLVNGIWNKGYTTIAATNNILSKIDDKKAIFTENHYAMVKGETLGIRAYLHFDLLRLYGANFAANPTKKAIPFRTELNALSKVPSTVDEVSTAILADLKTAEGLMKDKDPITQDKNRRFRMNYYAIKALQARVYLFRGDKINAAAAAKEVLNSGFFKLIEAKLVSASAGSRDRTFSTEQVFALRVRDIRNWVENGNAYFKSVTDSRNNLTRTRSDFETLYETGTIGGSDIRFVNLIQADGSNYFCSKYWQTWVPSESTTPESERLDQNVSLVRLSEMYYILAETAATPDEGLGYLNTVRDRRGLPVIAAGVTAQKLTDEITKEYQKDFYAEGQLFYYYKRKLFNRMQFSTRNLMEASYIVPIPDNELEFNPNYN